MMTDVEAVLTVVVHGVLLPTLQLCHHAEERHIQHVSRRSARRLRQPWRPCSRDADCRSGTRTAPDWSSHC